MGIRKGRPPSARGIASVRELTKADIEKLDSPDRVKVPAVQRFRDSHHWVARLYALGLRHEQVSLETGYSLQRLYTLYGDPTFQELISQYRGEVNEAYREGVDEYYSLRKRNQMKAERQIGDRLDKADEQDETLPIRDLISISRDEKRSVNINFSGDFASMLEKANARSAKVIEGTARHIGSSTTTPQPSDAQAAPSLRRRA